MANEKRLIVADYDAVRAAFDNEFRATSKLIQDGETHLDNLAEGFTEADRVLREMSTVDAVEVVRCGRCRYGEEIEDGLFLCHYEGMTWNPADHFCSYGERREDA